MAMVMKITSSYSAGTEGLAYKIQRKFDLPCGNYRHLLLNMRSYQLHPEDI
jgi:hypothetical protein